MSIYSRCIYNEKRPVLLQKQVFFVLLKTILQFFLPLPPAFHYGAAGTGGGKK
jgi:hypothetical protein